MAQKGVSLIKAAFDTDNFLMRFSEKVLDIVTANLLFVVSCLPIVTIGVAKISLYETMFEVKKSRRVPVFKNLSKIFQAKSETRSSAGFNGVRNCVSYPFRSLSFLGSNSSALPIAESHLFRYSDFSYYRDAG
ncbi:hypothetical protein SPAR155_1617 [Streptococcus pneumoniae GA04672]|nr:hypothetical protein SPAR155_1617 [Streptococcus pneumoniae GA04672]